MLQLLKIIIFVLPKLASKSAKSQNDSSLLKIFCGTFADLENITIVGRHAGCKRQL